MFQMSQCLEIFTVCPSLYYFQTVSIIQFLVRLMNETEARFTSIERLHEYEAVRHTIKENGST